MQNTEQKDPALCGSIRQIYPIIASWITWPASEDAFPRCLTFASVSRRAPADERTSKVRSYSEFYSCEDLALVP